MKYLTVCLVLSLLLISSIEEATSADVRQPGEQFKVTAGQDRARLCPAPDCDDGSHLARLPTGSVHTVLSCRITKLPALDVAWYEVEFNGLNGWVSEFDLEDRPTAEQIMNGRWLKC